MNKKLLISCVALTVMATLTACSSDEIEAEPLKPAQAPTSLNPHLKNIQVNSKDATLEYENNVRRGAAIDQDGVKHFLSSTSASSSPMLMNNVKYNRQAQEAYANRVSNNTDKGVSKKEIPFERKRATALKGYTGDVQKFIQKNFKTGETKDYSYYELVRWQRFCNAGLGMDKKDWSFVKNKANLFPEDLVEKCTPPHNRLLKRKGFTVEE